MRILVAMSGGVDSSVAAALLREHGHEVVGVTLKLWSGESSSGCCSVSDVEDARRVAQQLGIDHHVFNFGDDFEKQVVAPYVRAHAAGETPNPCIECNRHIKFERLLQRTLALGFDALATGHHARVVPAPSGVRYLARGRDAAKDQSYVLHMLEQSQLAHVLFPVGSLAKREVREIAEHLGLRSAQKPESQDVCFIAGTAGRGGFLADRIDLHPGEVWDVSGRRIGAVDAVELVTIGQRRGLGISGGGERRFALDVDVAQQRVTVGPGSDLSVCAQELVGLRWVDGARSTPVEAQCSAHGTAAVARVEGSTLRWESPRRRVAPGQAVVLYERDLVVGSGVAGRSTTR